MDGLNIHPRIITSLKNGKSSNFYSKALVIKVLQGGMLSPKLFTEFLTDIDLYLPKSHGVILNQNLISYLLYADDLVLFSETAEGLQYLLNGLHQFCSRWHLILNEAKSKVLIFNKKPKNCDFSFGNETLETITQYKYLGVLFSSDRKSPTKETGKYLADQARKALFKIKQMTKHSLGRLSPKLALKMFDSQILPILEYTCEIWGTTKETPEIEGFQLQYLKYMLGVKTQTSTVAVYAETGRFPLVLRQYLQMLKYWLRISNLPVENAVREAYDAQVALFNDSFPSWCDKILNILSQIEMNHVFQNLDKYEDDHAGLLSLANQRLHENKSTSLISDIRLCDGTSKLRNYKCFKTTLGLEPYLFQLKNQKMATTLSRFRLSSHPLEIELGRHARPKIHKELRVCRVCTQNQVEDEMHFLLQCPSYCERRETLFNQIEKFCDVKTLDSPVKYAEIMSSKDETVMKALGAYIVDCLKLRMHILREPGGNSN